MTNRFRLLTLVGGAALGLSSLGISIATAQAQDPPPPPATAAVPAPPPDAPPPPPRGSRARRTPPPPCGAPQAAAASGISASAQGKIRQFNYGPEGEISGFLISDGAQVNLGPETGNQLASMVKVGSEISVAGYRRQGASGRTVLDATSITANGQTVNVTVGPGAPPPPPDQQSPAPPQP